MNLFYFSEAKELEEAVQILKENYPKVADGRKWYLSPCRRSSVFKAFLISERAPRISKDSNSQEGIGGDLKRRFKKLSSDLGPSLQSLYFYLIAFKQILQP
jgi:hypothetical protein